MNKNYYRNVVTLFLVLLALAAQAQALQIDLFSVYQKGGYTETGIYSSGSSAVNYSYSASDYTGRLGLGLAGRDYLLGSPILGELKATYFTEGTMYVVSGGTTYSDKLQIIPLEANALWDLSKVVPLPMMFGFGLNYSLWSSSSSPSTTFSGGLGYQIFLEAIVAQSAQADSIIQFGFQTNNSPIRDSGTGYTIGGNSKSEGLYFTGGYRFNLDKPNARQYGYEPVASVALAEKATAAPAQVENAPVSVVDVSLPTDASMLVSAAVVAPVQALKVVEAPALITSPSSNQWKRGQSTLLMIFPAEGTKLTAAWVNINGNRWTTLKAKKDGSFKNAAVFPRSIKTPVKVTWVALTEGGKKLVLDRMVMPL